MPLFRYTAQPQNGDRTHGEIEAPDLGGAATLLRGQGFRILNLREAVAENFSAASAEKAIAEMRSPILLDRLKKYLLIGNQDRIFMLRHLAVMTRAGIPLTRALNLLVQQVEKLRMRDAVAKISKDVQAGESLSVAIENQPHIAPDYASKIIASSEESGELAPGLERIADRIEFWTEMKKKIISSMIYPAIVLVVAIIVDAVLMLYFVPSFERLITQSGKPVPAITQTLFNISNFLQDNALLILLFLLLATAGLIFAFMREKGRRALELVFLNIPILGKVAIAAVMAQFAGMMSVMLDSGLSLVRAIGLVTESTKFRIYHDIFASAAERIVAGEPLFQALAEPLVPKTAIGVVAAGEESGSLVHAFTELETFYTKQLSDLVGLISALIGPMLIILVGVVVAFVYFALFMAIRNLV